MIASPACPSCGLHIPYVFLFQQETGEPFPCPKCKSKCALIIVGPLAFQALADMTSDWAFANDRQ